jgi:hypothetical protein
MLEKLPSGHSFFAIATETSARYRHDYLWRQQNEADNGLAGVIAARDWPGPRLKLTIENETRSDTFALVHRFPALL